MFAFLLGTMIIPFTVIVIPLYFIMRDLKWIDTFWPLIIPGVANAFGIFFMRQYISTITVELLDAARIDGAGEFEIGGVFITGVQTDGGSSRKKGKDDAARNTIYVFDYDGITVAHLGDLKHTPTQSEIESLGTINVALVPVGGGGGLNAAKAAEIISLLEPNLVIPMHYSTPAVKLPLDTLNKFIKEMGLSQTETQPSLKVTRSSLPHETHVSVLEYQTS